MINRNNDTQKLTRQFTSPLSEQYIYRRGQIVGGIYKPGKKQEIGIYGFSGSQCLQIHEIGKISAT